MITHLKYVLFQRPIYFGGVPDYCTLIEGYDITLAKTWNKLKYSRIVLLTKKGFQFKVEENRMEDTISTIWIKVGGRGLKGVRICGIYREHKIIKQPEPNLSDDVRCQVQRWKKIIGQWIDGSSADSCLIIGDTNIDALKWTNPDQAIEEMVDTIKEEIITRNFQQIIQGPTRFWVNKDPSLIDQVWSNSPQRISEIKNFTRSTADHNVICVSHRMKAKQSTTQESVSRNWSNFKEDEFKRQITLEDWTPILSSKSLEEANFMFQEQFLKILDAMAPLRRNQPRRRNSGWISKATRDKMTRRDMIRDKAVLTNLPEDWTNYKEIKNQVNRDVKRDKKEHNEEIYEKIMEKKDAKMLYRACKNKLGWTHGGTPESFLLDGKPTRNPREMAQAQMNAWENKVTRLMSNIPTRTEDPLNILDKAFSRWEKTSRTEELVFQPARRKEIIDAIKDLGNGHAYGQDTLDGSLMKLVAEGIAAPIEHIVNLSIVNSSFTSRWKMAKLIPLHKGGIKSKLEPESFRPIALLPQVSKIVEKIIKLQIVQHFDTNKMWNSNLHSYRKLLSTTTALSDICDRVITASEDKEIAAAIAIDESAAFDTIPHQTLLRKMKKYKMSNSAMKWINDYISNRTQYTSIGGQESTMRIVKAGVPQGSILGPILYNIFINDLPDLCNDYVNCSNENHRNTQDLFPENCKSCGMITSFADDAIFVTSNRNREQNQNRLSLMLETMKTYLNNNGMSVNPSKTILFEFMLKQKQCKTQGTPPYLVTLTDKGDIKVLSPKESSICLGGTLQRDLQWKSMIETGEEAILPILRKKLGALKFIGRDIPRNGRLLLSNGIILGKLNYLLVLYGGTQYKYLRKLQVLCNDTMRFITGAGRRTKTQDLVKMVNWMTVVEMIKYQTIIAAWKIIWKDTPINMARNFSINDDKTLNTNTPRLQNSKYGMRWRIYQEWNSIPQEYREVNTLPVFKARIKKWIISCRTSEDLVEQIDEIENMEDRVDLDDIENMEDTEDPDEAENEDGNQ